jgi:hypothetical protein
MNKYIALGAAVIVSVSAVSAVAVGAPTCPSPVKGSKIPSKTYSPTSTKPGYWAQDSAIITQGGIPQTPSASYADVKNSMGGAFAGAEFKIVGGAGSDSSLPEGAFTCSYDGPWYHHGSQTLSATVTIVCTGSSCPGV